MDISKKIQDDAIAMMVAHKTDWETATAFVTDRVAFQMRELIKTLRKNYWGIFDEPIDAQTGREKTWVPLTESIVDSVVKNIDLDQKDVNFRAKNVESTGWVSVVRNVVKNFLDSIFFGEYLDEMERNLAIDGTAVWKTYEESNKEGEREACIVPVDLLNFYIDPCARSIQDTPAVMERALSTPDEVKEMTGWINTEEVKGIEGLSPNDSNSRTFAVLTPMVEIWEHWGKMSKFLITGKEEDREELVDGHIVASNILHDPKIHLVELMKGEHKPYEECWYKRVNGRWYGRGAAEMVMMLQFWLNAIVNIRINRSYVSQLGLFKIRKGSGITPQMLSRLPVNGVIELGNMADVEQMAVQEASQASYNDEEIIKGWSERVTSAFDIASGESLPASTPATNAILQSRGAQSGFVFVKEGIGMFLQRWLKRHLLPLLEKNLSSTEIVRMTGTSSELQELDNRVVNHLLCDLLEKMHNNGEFISPEKVEKERQRLLQKFQSQGEDRFIPMKDKLRFSNYDVEVFITNEEMDKGVLAANLTTVLQSVANMPNSGIDPNSVLRAIFDVMGLEWAQYKTKQSLTPQMQQLPPEIAQMMAGQLPPTAPQPGMDASMSTPVPNEQSVVTKANITA